MSFPPAWPRISASPLGSAHGAGVGLALLAATGFASKGIFIKFAYRLGMDGETLLVLRMVMASALFALVMLARRTHRGGFARGAKTPGAPAPSTRAVSVNDWAALCGLGFLGYYLSSLLDFKGLEILPASVERLLLMLYPTFTVVLTAILLRRRHPWVVWVALPICYGGMVLVIGQPALLGPGSLLGILLVMSSTLSYAFYMVLSPGVIGRVGSMVFSERVFLVSTLMMVCHYGVSHGLASHRMADFVHLKPMVWVWVALLAVFSTVVPLYALSGAVARIGSARTSVLGMGGPLLTIGASALLLGERLTGIQGVGAALILGGVLLAGRKGGRV